DTDTVDTDTAETDAAAMESAAVDGELGDEAETEAAFEAFMAEEHAAATQPNEVTEFLAAREDMSIFLMLLAQAGMSETLLEGDRPITIFAPSDSAFAKMDRLQFSTLVDDPDELRRVLERHIATETLSSADLDDRLSAEGAVAGGGAGDMEVAAAPETEAVGGDAEVGAETAADEATEAALLDPNAFVRVSTRAGEDIEIGRLSATDRVAAMTPAADAAAEGTDAADATEVAGGGAADDAGAATAETVRAVPGIIYVGDAQVVESDLSAGDTTIHVVDAVLLPPMPEEEDEAAQ
ncbi:MAG: fasciclin domain-containing protein, partial [Trueperaceae bacterium]